MIPKLDFASESPRRLVKIQIASPHSQIQYDWGEALESIFLTMLKKYHSWELLCYTIFPLTFKKKKETNKPVKFWVLQNWNMDTFINIPMKHRRNLFTHENSQEIIWFQAMTCSWQSNSSSSASVICESILPGDWPVTSIMFSFNR